MSFCYKYSITAKDCRDDSAVKNTPIGEHPSPGPDKCSPHPHQKNLFFAINGDHYITQNHNQSKCRYGVQSQGIHLQNNPCTQGSGIRRKGGKSLRVGSYTQSHQHNGLTKEKIDRLTWIEESSPHLNPTQRTTGN